jgi:cytochrome c biogenesis protein CcmG, thiol:disulfide interchange protein DsbE
MISDRVKIQTARQIIRVFTLTADVIKAGSPTCPGRFQIRRKNNGKQSDFRNAAFLVIILLAPLFAPVHADAAVRVGDQLPSVVFPALVGEPIRVPDNLKGKVTILHFWQAGCSSCSLEIPALDQLYSKYRNRGLTVLAVNVGQQKDAVKAFAASLNVSYPILLDSDGKKSALYDVTDVPRTYIIDRSGIVRYRILGGASPAMLQKLALGLL